MKIFMLVSRVPWPLEKGDKLRAYHQLRILAEKHEVFLCCLSDKEVDPKALEHLKTITPHIQVIRLNRLLIAIRLFRALFSSKPFQVHYFFQWHASKKIRESIDQFKPDHIYCQLIRASEYVKNLHEYRKTLDYMDALSSGLQRRLATSNALMRVFVREESKRLLAYENLIYDYFERHTIISAQDRQFIFHPNRNDIAIVPNGIDSDFFHSRVTEKKYDIAFTGNMSYPPNVDCAIRLAKEILPVIRKSRPGATLLIAGANPSRAVQQLQEDGITVTGWVEDIRDAYNTTRIFMAPMRIGSGLQNKLLEAMCMSLPCITSSLASGAMKAEHEKHLLIGEDNSELAGMALRLLDNAGYAEQLAAQGHDFVVTHFNWRSTVGLLEKQFES